MKAVIIDLKAKNYNMTVSYLLMKHFSIGQKTMLLNEFLCCKIHWETYSI